uniref:Uncharacterized protein n=1 Tax=Arundo donax TaxID=35708 RepID=A0A0A9B0X3_ARUDO
MHITGPCSRSRVNQQLIQTYLFLSCK